MSVLHESNVTQTMNYAPLRSSVKPVIRRPRVLWITNLAAPYRLPVWRSLGERFDLTVGLLESNISLKKDAGANRGPDWLHTSKSGVSFVELPTWKIRKGEARYYFLKGLSIAYLIRNSDVILFGGWESPAYWLAACLSIFCAVGRVGFYESPMNTMRHRKGPIAWIRKAFFHSMHAIVTPGPAATNSLLHMGIKKKKIIEGFNAVDVQRFWNEAATRPATATNSGHVAEGHAYLYVGQLISRKRVRNIIDSFDSVATEHDTLTIVGSGPLKEELEVLSHSVDSNISFLPTIRNEELPALMAAHSTLVLASHTEVWGLVVNEALASGMHVVVTKNCGVALSVETMPGVFVADEDLSDLSDRLADSRQSWRGRIQYPAILSQTPEMLARKFDAAFRAARLISSSGLGQYVKYADDASVPETSSRTGAGKL